MPEISRFFGIITMNYNDHVPPHFHARYGSDQAIVDIQTLQVLGGRLSLRIIGLVVEWPCSTVQSYWRTGAWRARTPH